MLFIEHFTKIKSIVIAIHIKFFAKFLIPKKRIHTIKKYFKIVFILLKLKK